jgi:hypothetical protein
MVMSNTEHSKRERKVEKNRWSSSLQREQQLTPTGIVVQQKLFEEPHEASFGRNKNWQSD